jgi:NodT family efflux transporter outer membrane factor (OMF) lipoprotein
VLFQTLREKANAFRAKHWTQHLVILLLLAPLFLGGCMAVGPDYEEPEQPEIPRSVTNTVDVALWWNQFNDPLLTEMVEKALEHNHDLRSAASRVRQARAEMGRVKAALGPTVNLTGSVNRFQPAENASQFGTAYAPPEAFDSQTLYSGGFDAVWEIDLFGAVRRGVEYASADYAARELDLASVQVTVAAETARAYLLARTFQYRLAAARSNLAVQRETLEVLESSFSAGLVNELAVQQARYNYQATRASIPALEAGLASSRTALAVLIGEMPGTLELPEGQGVPQSALAVEGIPADLLRRRPDVRRAERELAARTAMVGVSTAELYPRFTLTGSIGLESLDTSNFFESGSERYSIAPGVRWPILNWGSIRNNIKVQEARQEQALIAYEATVLNAVKEVHDALSDYRKEVERRDALGLAVEAAREALSLADEQYRSGLTDFRNVLDAQRSLLALEEQFAVSEGEVARNAVRLYKALGGGWEPME